MVACGNITKAFLHDHVSPLPQAVLLIDDRRLCNELRVSTNSLLILGPAWSYTAGNMD